MSNGARKLFFGAHGARTHSALAFVTMWSHVVGWRVHGAHAEKTDKIMAKTDEPRDPDIEDKRSKEFGERLRRLKGRAISAREAWRCCVRSKRQAQKLLLDYAQSIVDIVANRMQEAFVAPIPPSVVKVVQVGVGVAPKTMKIGWVTTAGIVGMVATEPATNAQAELVAEHMKVASETIRRTEEDCLRCVEQKIWQQKTKRKRVRVLQVKKGMRGIGKSKYIFRRLPGGAKP